MSDENTTQQRPSQTLSFRLIYLLDLILAAGALFLGYLFPTDISMLVLAAIALAICVITFILATKRRLFTSIAVLAAPAIFLSYLFFWPMPFEPVAGPKRAENPAGTGVFAPNNALADAELLDAGEGPECVALDGQGRIYTGLLDGRIMRFSASGREELVNTGGRPLGIEFDGAGNLIIADSEKGLLSLSPDATLEELSTEVDGTRMIFVDDLAIAKDGKIYFSDASQHFHYGTQEWELFERQPSGRLLVYNPLTKETRVLVENLYFANGVALSADESFVIVVESFEHRIMRYWLQGPKAGTSDVFAENLPGYLDNITEAPDGGFWLAVVAPRNDFIDSLVDQPFRRKILWRLTQLVDPPRPKHSYAVKMSAEAEPLQSLEDNSGHIFALTSVLENDGKLYLGSFVNHVIGIMDVP